MPGLDLPPSDPTPQALIAAPPAPLALPGGLDARTVNPARLYVASLAPGSRPAAVSVLGGVAQALGSTLDGVGWPDLRHAHLLALRATLAARYAPRTVNRALSLVRGVLKVAWSNHQMGTDEYQRAISVAGLTKPGPTTAGRALADEEVRALLLAARRLPGAPGARAAAVVALLFGAGLRRFEVGRLLAEHVEGGAVRVEGKRGKWRTVPLGPGWIEPVEAWLKLRGAAPGPLVVQFDRGGALTERGVSSVTVAAIMEEARAAAGLAPATPHDLRRTFATSLLDRGVDLSEVQKLMGHEDVRTTTIYDRRGLEAGRRAVEKLTSAEEESP